MVYLCPQSGKNSRYAPAGSGIIFSRARADRSSPKIEYAHVLFFYNRHNRRTAVIKLSRNKVNAAGTDIMKCIVYSSCLVRTDDAAKQGIDRYRTTRCVDNKLMYCGSAGTSFYGTLPGDKVVVRQFQKCSCIPSSEFPDTGTGEMEPVGIAGSDDKVF